VQPDSRRALAIGQGAYFLATGVWPLVHMASFLHVTGKKHDLWLVRTVGALIAVVGATVLAAGGRNRVTPEIALLAGGTAAALGAIDVIYTSRGRIPPVYLLDGVAEAALATLWLRRTSPGSSSR
jgi:hypothetical protein